MTEKQNTTKWFENFRDLLLYGGVTSEEYENIRPRIDEINRNTVTMVSGCATILIFAMFISSIFLPGVQMNQTVYRIGFVVSLLLFLSSLLLAKRYRILIAPLMAGAYSIFFIYGILIGTVTDPGNKTVTFIVMLVFLTDLFVDRPFHMASVTSVYIAVFIFLCYKTKTGAVLDNDVIDAIIFGILGITHGTYSCQTKVRGYLSEFNYREMGQIDKLTGLKTQNAYNAEKYSIPKLCREDLACIFVDVNGLKFINDNYGHEKGNEMLSFIGEQIKEHFGEKLTYRFGGDEFYIFIPDPKYYEIKTITDKMAQIIEAENYSVSIGWKIHPKSRINMDMLVSEAEKFMYEKKSDFYKNNTRIKRRT